MGNIFRLIFMAILVSSCSNLSSIDKPVCVEINMAKAYCTTIISGRGFYIDDENKYQDKTWFEMSAGTMRVPADTWAALKKYLIMNCKRYKKCNVNIDSWDRSTQIIEDHLNLGHDKSSDNGSAIEGPALLR